MGGETGGSTFQERNGISSDNNYNMMLNGSNPLI